MLGMTKKKQSANIYYTKPYYQVIDQLNIECPVNLKHNLDLVERVHQRYPLIDKYQVAIIVNAVFSSFRDLLVQGKSLNFNSLFLSAKLIFFTHRRNGHIFPALKAQITTPPPLRKKNGTR